MAYVWLVLLYTLLPVLSLIMPMTKQDGGADIASIISHITLLEQVADAHRKATADELVLLKTQVKTMRTELNNVNADLRSAQRELAGLEYIRSDLNQVKADVKAAQSGLAVLGFQMNLTRPSNTTQDLVLEMSKLKSDVISLQSQCQLNATTSHVSSDHSDIITLKSYVSNIQQEVLTLGTHYNSTQQSNQKTGGATYIRWGRTSCPSDNNLTYEGYAGGTYYANKASAATILCLPKDPIYAVHDDFHHGLSDIYGVEYEYTNEGGIPAFQSLHDEDMPCEVCQSAARIRTMMVPARNQCYPGWTLEYWGYLMGPRNDFASGEYICVDSHPQATRGGHANTNGQVMHLVESKCGALPCPPYHDNWEVTCCVCSQ